MGWNLPGFSGLYLLPLPYYEVVVVVALLPRRSAYYLDPLPCPNRGEPGSCLYESWPWSKALCLSALGKAGRFQGASPGDPTCRQSLYCTSLACCGSLMRRDKEEVTVAQTLCTMESIGAPLTAAAPWAVLLPTTTRPQPFPGFLVPCPSSLYTLDTELLEYRQRLIFL